MRQPFHTSLLDWTCSRLLYTVRTVWYHFFMHGGSVQLQLALPILITYFLWHPGVLIGLVLFALVQFEWKVINLWCSQSWKIKVKNSSISFCKQCPCHVMSMTMADNVSCGLLGLKFHFFFSTNAVEFTSIVWVVEEISETGLLKPRTIYIQLEVCEYLCFGWNDPFAIYSLICFSRWLHNRPSAPCLLNWSSVPPRV